MKNIIASLVISGSLIFSALLISGAIDVKNGHVLSVTDGHIKLGDVYAESKQISYKLIVDGENGPYILFSENNINPDDAAQKITDHLTEMAKEVNKVVGVNEAIHPETMSLKYNSHFVISASVKYNAQYQPSFTLNLKDKTYDYDKNIMLFSDLRNDVRSFIREQEASYNNALFLK